ncbi:reverse transcriptase [Phytophthora megakarya]|uniref:Reverse transcriptase n=1 Tax=Phytophthora megakarya TaxID=4795 RepID=A0A225VC31_9STRA|nr:reverse transcriptase [Phytophthora megakarya]
MWFMSLDMASGFWAVRMTERAKLISAFTCPFGHIQWVRMPFGLKNAPLIYQQMINNCLWGFVQLSPEEEALVDQDVLDYLKLNPQSPSDKMDVERSMTPLVEQMTVFRRNIPAPSQMGPVLGRSSYIDDIAHGAATISVSLPKSEFGKRVIPYLSHEIGAEGIRVTPKIVKGIQELPFPSTLKRSSLNYYHKFIEDYAVVAASLYELTDDQESFEILKKKIVSTPLLRHPDRTKPFVIIPHANQWAACAVLGQMHDGLVQPVRFTGRVLSDAELKYHIAEKEVLAVMRVLHVFKNVIKGCPLIIYTRHSVLKWVINSRTAEGRLVPWGVALSQYDLEIRKVSRDEDGLAAIMGAGITPREHLDEVAEVLIPAKGRVKPPPVDDLEKQHLEVVSKLREQLVKSSENTGARVRSGDLVQDPGEEDGNSETRHSPGPECAPLPSAARVMAVLTRSRAEEADDDKVAPIRIKVHQEEDEYLAEIRAFLNDDLDRFSSTRLKKISKVGDLFVLDDRGVLYRLPHSVRRRPRDAVDNLRLVVPSSLREDMLPHAHEDFQGGHQGITLARHVCGRPTFVKKCVDCASGKGAPPNAGPSPGNIEPRYPFEAVSMDFVTHMPESARENTFLLLFQDMFSGYVMCKPMFHYRSRYC